MKNIVLILAAIVVSVAPDYSFSGTDSYKVMGNDYAIDFYLGLMTIDKNVVVLKYNDEGLIDVEQEEVTENSKVPLLGDIKYYHVYPALLDKLTAHENPAYSETIGNKEFRLGASHCSEVMAAAYIVTFSTQTKPYDLEVSKDLPGYFTDWASGFWSYLKKSTTDEEYKKMLASLALNAETAIVQCWANYSELYHQWKEDNFVDYYNWLDEIDHILERLPPKSTSHLGIFDQVQNYDNTLHR